MKKPTYDVHTAIRTTGATMRQIEHLVQTGVVRPATAAPRRGMSRTFTIPTLRYIAVAARLLNWGLEVEDVTEIIGTDRDKYVEDLWTQLGDPKRRDEVEILWVARVPPDMVQGGKLGDPFRYIGAPMPADRIVRAARGGLDGCFIHLRAVAAEIEMGTTGGHQYQFDLPALPSDSGPYDVPNLLAGGLARLLPKSGRSRVRKKRL